MQRSCKFYFSLSLFAAFAPFTYAKEIYLDDLALKRSLIAFDQTGLINDVLQKKGAQLRVGYIGGSITQGALAEPIQNSFSNIIAPCMANIFNAKEVKLFNAGIGSTTSKYGAYRLQKNLLSKNLDVIFVDFAVNDLNNQDFAESYEGIVRQILNHGKVAPVLLFFTTENGDSSQSFQSKIGKYYGLPMISVKDAIIPDVIGGKVKWAEYSPDSVHPNNEGHNYIKKIICNHMQLQAKRPHIIDSIDPLIPIYSKSWERAMLVSADELLVNKKNGFKLEKKGFDEPLWITNRPGSFISFAINSDRVDIIFRRSSKSSYVKITVDDKPPQELNINNLGGPSTNRLFLNLIGSDVRHGSNKHTIQIELLESKGNGGNSEVIIEGFGIFKPLKFM